MKTVHRIVWVSGVIAVLVGLARGYIEEQAPWASGVAFWLLVAALLLYLGASAIGPILNALYFGQGRYSVLLFVLDSDQRLLLVYHPFHKRLIPPGGRLRMWELPHEAISRVLLEETGIERFEFHPMFHITPKGYTDAVTVLPAPHQVQREDRRQRNFIKFHYAFVYVLQASADAISTGKEGYEPNWYTHEQVIALAPPRRPFDDIIRRYEHILKDLGQTDA